MGWAAARADIELHALTKRIVGDCPLCLKGDARPYWRGSSCSLYLDRDAEGACRYRPRKEGGAKQRLPVAAPCIGFTEPATRHIAHDYQDVEGLRPRARQ